LALSTGIPYSFHHFLSSVGEAYDAQLLQVHCKLSVSHIKEAYVTSTTRTQRFPVLCPFRCAAFPSCGRKAQRVKRDGASPMHTAPPKEDSHLGKRGPPRRRWDCQQRTALHTKMHELIRCLCRESIVVCVQSAKCYSKMVRSKRSYGICTQQYTLPSAREKVDLTLCHWFVAFVRSANNQLSPQ